MDSEEKLLGLDCSKVGRFSFCGLKVFARVTNVYDPDTITVIFIWKDDPIKINIRLDGIDAPEKKSRRILETEACAIGTKILKDLIHDKIVYIECGSFDKYGRTLGKVYVDSNDCATNDKKRICVNDYLIECKCVRAYDGGKKPEWTDEELLRIKSINDHLN